MNPGSADKALDFVNNVDMEWMQHSSAGLTRQPDPRRSSSAMDEELEMELINILNNADKRSRMMAVPAINSGGMNSCYLAADMKPESEMRRIAASLFNSVEATSVTTRAVQRSSGSMEINNMSAAANTSSGFHRYSSALPSGPAMVAAAGGTLPRGTGTVKVKKKRVRPSRRVPTTVVKTDASNFKAMVEQFTGIPPSLTTTQESTVDPSASSSSPHSTNTDNSPSFSKPLPHPVLCKISNSSAMAEHFTGNSTTTTTTQEYTTSNSASSSSPKSISPPQSISPASFPSFSKPLPHPAVCKLSNTYAVASNPNTSAATATYPSSPLLPSSFPLPEVPYISTVASTTGSGDSGYFPNSADPEGLTMTSIIDAAFFDEFWN